MKIQPMLWVIAVAMCSCTQKKTIFRELKPEYTNITFSNTVTEDDNINMITYEYLYNGGGVGIGDFNNDKLPDIYFASSLGSNKLYLNKGKFKFEDVTGVADVTGEKRWSRGVSVVDINNDGLPDIYVCATTWQTPEQRRNLLYVNQGVNPSTGIPRFAEMAKEYGLDDTASTHMAAFFDYDNDGDLDVYLLVNRLSQETPNTFRPVRNDGNAINTDKLYRNDWSNELQHPVYTNVSKQAGITWEGFGLGVNILDINKDGWKDIYVSNDYLSGNILYINKRNGTFVNEVQDYFKHGSLNAMGNDAADINNDGLVDIIETDMAAEDNERFKMMMNPIDFNWYVYTSQYKFPYQTVRNTLQLNRGPRIKEGDSIAAPHFSEISFYAGVAYTDWSWAPLLMDANHDGYKDLMVTNGLPKDITDLDFIAYRDQHANTPVTELLLKLPPVKLSNYIYSNNGDATFTDKTLEWGWDIPGFSAGMAYADFDADGDMDVVISNTNMPATILENTINEDKDKPHHYLRLQFRGDTSNINGVGTIADIYYKGGRQTAELTPYRGYTSTMENVLHFGLGEADKADSIVIIWPTGKFDVMRDVKADQTLLISQSVSATAYSFQQPLTITGNLFSEVTTKAGIYYTYPPNPTVDFNLQRSIPHQFSHYGPALAAGDLNGDGLQDMLVGGNPQQKPFIYFQQLDGKFIAKPFNRDTLLQQQTDAGICLFDADKDNDPDIYIASGGFEFQKGDSRFADRLYINNGKGFFSEADPSVIPLIKSSKSCVKAADFDGDGYIDLFVGGRVAPGWYPQPESGYLLRNESKNGKVLFKDVTAQTAAGLQSIGLVTDALWSDADNDGDVDLMVTGEWMGIHFFKNDKGLLNKVTAATDNEKGWWNSISAADIDNDGDMDYIAGNYGLNGFYKANANEPVSAFFSDYDMNGRPDLLMSQYRAVKPHGNKIAYPALFRDQVAEGLPAIKKHYSNYSSFSKAGTEEVLNKFQRDDELKLSAINMQSGWMENKGNFEFAFHPLPAAAQWSVVYGIAVNDFNGDGNIDLALNGNDYSIAPVQGRADAFYGLLLQGDGKGNFTGLNALQSGLYIPGDGKALVQMQWGDDIALAASQNGGPLLFFKNNANNRLVPVEADITAAIITYKDGKKRKEEFYYGSSFYSQSARFIQISPAVKNVEFYIGKRMLKKIDN